MSYTNKYFLKFEKKDIDLKETSLLSNSLFNCKMLVI